MDNLETISPQQAAAKYAVEIRNGAAYLCNDGLIRWVTHISSRGLHHVSWRNVGSGDWHYGGKFKRNDLQSIVMGEVQSPQAGDEVAFIGPTGFQTKRII